MDNTRKVAEVVAIEPFLLVAHPHQDDVLVLRLQVGQERAESEAVHTALQEVV